MSPEQRIEAIIREQDQRQRQRVRQTLIGRLFLWLLDQASLHTTQLCRAYGGPWRDGEVRLCGKPRWHWDSHYYDLYEHAEGQHDRR